MSTPSRRQGGSGGGGGGRGGSSSNGGGGGGGGGQNRNRNRGSNQGGGGGRGNGSGGNRQRSSSGNRRPSGQGSRSGGNRGGQGQASRSSSRSAESSGPIAGGTRHAVAAVVRASERAENVEERQTIKANRRWAAMACAIPALVVGLILGAIVFLVGQPLVAIGVLVVAAAVVAGWVWQAAPGMVVRSVRAHPSSPEQHPRLHNVVEGLCATMGLPLPAVLMVESPVLNAMAIGRHPSTASLIVTSALDESLSVVELEGVVAQELVHIKRHDTLRSGIAVALVAPLTVLSSSGAMKVHSLVGPGREFSADQRAVGVVRYPTGLGSALSKMVESAGGSTWPPGGGRLAALTRWLWINPMAGSTSAAPADGELDDTGVRAAALAML